MTIYNADKIRRVLSGDAGVDALAEAFCWHSTLEGFDYWHSIASGDRPLDTAARSSLERMIGGVPVSNITLEYIQDMHQQGWDDLAIATILRLAMECQLDRLANFVESTYGAIHTPPSAIPDVGDYPTKDGGMARVLSVEDGRAFGWIIAPDGEVRWPTSWCPATGQVAETTSPYSTDQSIAT